MLDCGPYEHTYTLSGDLDVIEITVALDDECECHMGERYVRYMPLSNDGISADESGWIAY